MKKLLIIGLAVGLMTGAASAATVIDHFAFPTGTNVIDAIQTGTSSVTQLGATDAVGGQRDFVLTVTTANPPNEFKVTQFSSGAVHKLVAESGSSMVDSLELIYGAGAPLNLSLLGDNNLEFDLLFNDHDITVDVTLTDGAAVSHTEVFNLPANASPTAVNANLLLFSGAGVDLSDVDKISFLFDGPSQALDFELDSIETSNVPEPATMLLLGLVGLPFIRKLRRRA